VYFFRLALSTDNRFLKTKSVVKIIEGSQVYELQIKQLTVSICIFEDHFIIRSCFRLVGIKCFNYPSESLFLIFIIHYFFFFYCRKSSLQW
jgi:hypothetical protein